jgi:hypothetical protein
MKVLLFWRFNGLFWYKSKHHFTNYGDAMSIIKWPNSLILANTAGLSTGLCISSLGGNFEAALTGGLAVSLAISAFKDAMREVVRENRPTEAGSPVPKAAKPTLNS